MSTVVPYIMEFYDLAQKITKRYWSIMLLVSVYGSDIGTSMQLLPFLIGIRYHGGSPLKFPEVKKKMSSNLFLEKHVNTNV